MPALWKLKINTITTLFIQVFTLHCAILLFSLRLYKLTKAFYPIKCKKSRVTFSLHFNWMGTASSSGRKIKFYLHMLIAFMLCVLVPCRLVTSCHFGISSLVSSQPEKNKEVHDILKWYMKWHNGVNLTYCTSFLAWETQTWQWFL